MHFPISVITCTHNPRADYLTQILTALQEQTLDKQAWEFILIDNASDEPLAARLDLGWHPFARHVSEEQLGLTHARMRGIREARGDVLVFVDDDNVLDADYLERSLSISREWPILGAWGGQTRPGFEVPPPDWTKPYWGRLVIREFDQDRWSNQPTQAETMPCGAGMCVRKKVAAYYAELHANGRRKIVLDRTGNSLASGGDTDLAMCACDLGMGMGLFTSLKLTHLISAGRLTEDYLVRLVEGLAYSSVILNSFRPSIEAPAPPEWTTSVANVVRLLIKDRRQRRFFRAIRDGELRAQRHLASIKSGDLSFETGL
ncbi:MAG: glycosyltransferase family 2 protein [Acidobacteria bacterium]|jgi:glycosyltransferase involved in cell wall biosynthesis|nr:glycosyltransferase family 2 protein [Acidobacteriota bacterium]